MADCEICGFKEASVNVRIDSAILNACEDCAKSGKVIDAPRQVQQFAPIVSKPSAEELVVSDFGKVIGQARQRSGLKQDELANKLNEKLPVVQAAESGKRCDIKLAKKLEKFFGIKLVELA